MNSEITITAKLGGHYFCNGNRIEGAYQTDRDEYVLLDRETLIQYLRIADRCASLERSQTSMMKVIATGSKDAEKIKSLTAEVEMQRNTIAALEKKLSDGGSADMSDAFKQITSRATNARVKKKEKAIAVVLSCSILGMTTEESLYALERRGIKRTRSFVSRVLRVVEPQDRDRLKAIMSAYPEEFDSISTKQFDAWFDKKLKASKAKEPNNSQDSSSTTQVAAAPSTSDEDWGI